MSASAVGVIFSNLHEENVPELVRRRTMASIPFGGRYRLIDFPLSNMVNAGIMTVGLMANNNALQTVFGRLALHSTKRL